MITIAALNASNWIAEEQGSSVLTTITTNSAAEAFARRENMNTDALRVPRMSDIDVNAIAMSQPYPEDTANLDTVLLEAVKFGSRVVVPVEQLDDSNVNIITELQNSWGRSYAAKIDNAVFGTSAAANGTLTVPFNSVYREVSQNAASHKIATAGPVTFESLSAVLGKYENGGYFSDPDTIIVAHTSLKEGLRNIVDLNGRPLFIDAIPNAQPASLFGYQIQFSAGAKVSATNLVNPAGNSLLVVGNKNHLILGVRSGPESLLSADAGFGTDEIHLKLRSRRGFAVGRATAFGVLEVTAAP